MEVIGLMKIIKQFTTILKNYISFFRSKIANKKKTKKDKEEDPFIYPHY